MTSPSTGTPPRRGRPTARRGLLAGALLLSVATTAAAQAMPGAARGAPLVPWQRDLDDALALSRATGKPLLVCVNADGEPASESLAARRYRDPAFVALMEGFVPVIASPDVHTDRTHDSRGRRVPCSRFGRVTCDEHIRIEPLVFERWFDGTRVAPRHLAVSPDGEVLFDLYLLNDLGVLDTRFSGYEGAGEPLPDVTELDERGLLASPDAAARERIEAVAVRADADVRLRLVLGALSDTRDVAHPELLRLGLRDAEAHVRRAAAERVAADPTGLPTDLLAGAARALHDDDVLVATVLAELGARDDTASQRLATVLGAAREPSEALDPAAWSRKLSATDADETPPSARVLEGLAARLDKELAAAPDDAALRARLARAYVDLARAQQDAGAEDVAYLWELARAEARTVIDGGDAPAAAHAVFARTDWLLGGTAEDAARSAARALPGLFVEARSPFAAEVLDVLVQARAEQALATLDAGTLPEPAWISDVAAGARLLVVHPHATPWQRGAALDVVGALALDGLHADLAWLGVTERPTAAVLHEHLRWHLLRDGDAARVGDVYEDLLATVGPDERPAVRWYQAFARLQAGDRLWDERRPDEAAASFRASLEGFDEALALDGTLTNATGYAALARTGLARVLAARGDLAGAARELLAGLDPGRRDLLDLPDSLGETPRFVVMDVRDRLLDGSPTDDERALAASLDGLLEFGR